MNILKLFGFGKKVTKIEPVIDTTEMFLGAIRAIDEAIAVVEAKPVSLDELLVDMKSDEQRLPITYSFYSEEEIDELEEHQDDISNEREAYLKEQNKLNMELEPSSEALRAISERHSVRASSDVVMRRKAMVKKNGN